MLKGALIGFAVALGMLLPPIPFPNLELNPPSPLPQGPQQNRWHQATAQSTILGEDRIINLPQPAGKGLAVSWKRRGKACPHPVDERAGPLKTRWALPSLRQFDGAEPNPNR